MGRSPAGNAGTVGRQFRGVARDIDNDSLQVDLDVCYDVSAVSVTDVDGTSVVSAERPDVQPLEIRLVSAETPTHLGIDLISGSESELDC